MLSFFGTVFLVLIGLLVILGLWIYVKVKGGYAEHQRIAAIEESMHLPEILLEPNDHPAYSKPEAVAMLTRQAEALGATHCGNYDVPAAEARLSAWCLEAPPVYIAITDHGQIDPWTDVVLRLENDRSYMASTLPEIGRGAPRDPNDEAVYFAPGTDTGVLVRAAAERAASDSVLPTAPESFKDYSEVQAEKSRKFIQTQSVSQEWLDTIAADAGVELSGDEAERINLIREDQQAVDMETACFDALAESGDFTAAEWNKIRDDLVAVWDDMPGDYAAGVFYRLIEVPMELEDEVDDLEQARGFARRRVAELNEKLPDDIRLILVGKVSSPVEADIYRSPATPHYVS